MTSQISGIRAARTSRPRPDYLRVVPDVRPAYDYDAAHRLIAAIQRAATNPEYLEGVLYGYEQSGRQETAAKFTAAVEEQRRFAAENEIDTADVAEIPAASA